jgi:uncharacterized protein YndB with AHSA1/START domain
MIRIEHSVVIDRSVDQVWDYLTDFQNTPKWDIGVVETKQTSAGPAGLGTTFQNIGPFLGRNSVREYRVTEVEPEQKISISLVSPSRLIQHAEISYMFQPDGDRTRLTFSGSLELKGIYKLLQPFLLQRAKKDGQGDLENLRRQLDPQTEQA